MKDNKTCEGCNHFIKLFNMPSSPNEMRCKKFPDKIIDTFKEKDPGFPNRLENCPFNEKEENLDIRKVCDNLNRFLQEKNKRYKNSALEPLKVFSKMKATNSLLVRIDDKISRISNSIELRKNDVVDLMGYLVLLCVDMNWGDFQDLID